MEEQVEEKVEEKVTLRCPRCKNILDKVEKSRKLNWYRCPICHRPLKSSIIPEGIEIIYIDTGTPFSKTKKIEREVREEEEVEEEEERRESLFREPRMPEEVLREILEEYRVNPRFIEIMVRRSKRKGGIHPIELQHYLLRMKSGVKDAEEAAFIAQEYADALEAEMREAERQGLEYPISSPISMDRRPTPTPSIGFRRPRYEEPPRYESSFGYGFSAFRRPRYEEPRQGEGQFLTKEEMMKTLMEWEKEREEKSKLDRILEVLQQREKEVLELKKELEHLKENPPGPVVPPGVVTKEELEKMQADSYRKVLEMQLEEYKRLAERLTEKLEKVEEKHIKEMKELQERFEKLLEKEREEKKEIMKEFERKLEKARSEAGEYNELKYKRDIADRVLEFGENVLEKGPVRRIIVETVGGEKKKPPKYEGEEEARVVEEELEEYGIPEEFVEEE